MVFCNLKHIKVKSNCLISHNPYFNRWFSAIIIEVIYMLIRTVTILILIDGFLQYNMGMVIGTIDSVTILILIDGFLQYV